jgi:hypothetical protein
MKRIAIVSVDERGARTANWLIEQLKECNVYPLLFDYRYTGGRETPENIAGKLDLETRSTELHSIHIGTRYDWAHLTKNELGTRLIGVIENMMKRVNKNLGYDKVFVIFWDKETTNEIVDIYSTIGLDCKVLPNRPETILGKMILKEISFECKGKCGYCMKEAILYNGLCKDCKRLRGK